MNWSPNPILRRAGLVFVFTGLAAACDSPTTPPIQDEKEDEDENEEKKDGFTQSSSRLSLNDGMLVIITG